MSKTTSKPSSKARGQRSASQVLSDWRYYLEFGSADEPIECNPASGHLERLIWTTRKLFHEAFDRQVQLVPATEAGLSNEPQSVGQILAERQINSAKIQPPVSSTEPLSTLPKPIDPTTQGFVNPATVDLRSQTKKAHQQQRLSWAVAGAIALGVLAGLIAGTILIWPK